MALRDAVEAGKAVKLDEMSETQHEVEAWIAAVTGKPFDKPFAEHLHDGSVLCELMNVIEPGSIKKINTSKLATIAAELFALLVTAVPILYSLAPKDGVPPRCIGIVCTTGGWEDACAMATKAAQAAHDVDATTVGRLTGAQSEAIRVLAEAVLGNATETYFHSNVTLGEILRGVAE